MLSIETAWRAVAQRRRQGAGCGFAPEALGAQMRQTFAVLEAVDEAAEAGPARLRRVASARGGEVGREAAAAGVTACDLAGAEIDHQVELVVGAEQG